MAFAPDTRIGGGADLFGRHGRIFVISLGNSEQVGEKRGFPRGQRKLFRDPWHGDCASVSLSGRLHGIHPPVPLSRQGRKEPFKETAPSAAGPFLRFSASLASLRRLVFVFTVKEVAIADRFHLFSRLKGRILLLSKSISLRPAPR